jgi:hypothetical protein
MIRELAVAAGLRSSYNRAIEDLTERYGEKPDTEFISEMWSTLRDGWLSRSPSDRAAIVDKLRASNRGDMSIKVSSKKGQVAYLRSLRRSPTLLDAVLETLLEYGSDKSETKKATFVEEPKDAEEQAEMFYAALLDRFQGLNKNTIEGVERVVYATICNALSDVTLPLSNPGDEASKIVSAVISAMLPDTAWETDNTELTDYQRFILEHINPASWSTVTIREIFKSFYFSVLRIFEDKNIEEVRGLVFMTNVFFLMALVPGDKNTFPEDFVPAIAKGQVRFSSSDDESDAVDDQRLSVSEAIGEIMARIPNSTKPTSEKNGAIRWQVFMGSAMVNVIYPPIGENEPPTMVFAAPIVDNIALSEELLNTLNLVNAEQRFYKYYWRDETLILEI